MAHGTILVPDSFGNLANWTDFGDGWPPHLVMNYDPESKECTFESSGCGALKVYTQEMYAQDGGGHGLHDAACALELCDNAMDYEHQIIEAVVGQQGYFDGDGHLTSAFLAEFLTQGCAIRAAQPEECYLDLLDAEDQADGADTWESVTAAVVWMVTNLPSGTRPTPSQQKIQQLRQRADSYCQQAMANLQARGLTRNQYSAQRWGQIAHKELKDVIDAASDPEVWAEVSYRGGTVVSGGTAGSVRPDIVLGTNTGQPLAILDLKTGAAGIRASWLTKLTNNLPQGFQHVPVGTLRC